MPVLFLVDPSMYCVMVHPWIISDQVSDLVLHQRTFSREKQCWDWVFFIEIILSAFLKSWLWFKKNFFEVLELFRISSKSPQNLQKAPRNLQKALKLFGKSFSRVSCMFVVLMDTPGALFEMDFRSPRLTILFQSASNRLRFSSESPRVILKRFWGASRSSPELVPVGEPYFDVVLMP